MFMITVTHVDDLTWSDTPESQEVIKYLKSKFPIEKENTGEFKFVGHEITQDEDFTVHVRCRDTTLKMDKVSIQQGKRSGDDQKATTDEYNQFRSVNGSLIWSRMFVDRMCPTV